MSAEAARKHWGWDEFLDWEARQPVKYEWVDGQVRAMTGGTFEHDTICNNLRFELVSRLRGSPCRLQGPDLKLQAGISARYPDVFIDCGVPIRGSVLAIKPVVVFEVLSKSTTFIDETIKLRDYESVPSILHYVLINQDEPRAMIYDRDESGSFGTRTLRLLEGLAETLTLADPDISIPLSALYEGVEFVERM